MEFILNGLKIDNKIPHIIITFMAHDTDSCPYVGWAVDALLHFPWLI